MTEQTDAEPESWPPPYGMAPSPPPQQEGRRVLSLCFRLLKSRPGLSLLAAAGFIASAALTFLVLVVVLGRVPDSHDFRFPQYFALYPAFIVGGLPAIFANAVVLVEADRTMRDIPGSLSNSVSQVARRAPSLIAWALLGGLVGLILQILESRLRLGGRLVTWMVGLSWAVATTFVVPCIVFESAGPVQAVRRSAHIFKERWGLNVKAQVATGAIAIIPSLAIGVAIALAAPRSVGLAIAIGVCYLALLAATFGAFQMVLNAALYRYTTEGTLIGEFTLADLEGSFKRRKR